MISIHSVILPLVLNRLRTPIEPIEESCSFTPSSGLMFIPLMTFSNTMLNNTGDIESPCLKPDFTDTGSVWLLFTLTLMNVSIIYIFSNSINFCGKFNSLIMLIKLFRWILSYAFLKSIKRTWISLSNTHVFWNICQRINIWSVVDLPDLKPPW